MFFRIMPCCSFCSKLCATAPGLERHIAHTPECKQASHKKFSQYANSIWDDVPANINHVEQHWQPEPLANLPDLPDFHLEEDIQIADETIDEQEINVPQQHPPPQDEPQNYPQHGAVDVPHNNEVNDGGRYVEKFPKEYLADATLGHWKPLFKSLDEEQKREGDSCWTPFKDEDEWQLAEWLIWNVGQKQTDDFLKLPIVSFFSLSPLPVNLFYQFTDSKAYATHLWE